MKDKGLHGFIGALKCLVGLHDWGNLPAQTSTHCLRCGKAARPRTYQRGNIVMGDIVKTKQPNTELLVVRQEVVSEIWRKQNPRHCPVVLRDGDGKSAGACWYYLRDGVYPVHGQIYECNE